MNWRNIIPWASKPPGRLSRSYSKVVERNDSNLAWITSPLSEDSQLRQYLPQMWEKSSSLAQTNPYALNIFDAWKTNIIGADGYSLQMKIAEEADRVVAGGTVKKGQPDSYANTLIERKFAEWGRAENCTITRNMTLQQVRETRVFLTARDGFCLIRMVDGFKNTFGFALQMIEAQFLDINFNEVLPNGNEVRMGVEFNGNRERVAFHVIKPQPNDWQNSASYCGFSSVNPRRERDRINASEIILSVRRHSAETTLAAPWLTPVMAMLYQLARLDEAEIQACREAAAKGIYFYSDIVPEGGAAYEGGVIDPTTGIPTEVLSPGDSIGLPYGVKPWQYDPKHPTANFPAARKEFLRSIATGAGMAFATVTGDLSDTSYSSARVGVLDERDGFKMLQKWDIETNELPVFEAWLAASLSIGAVPLPIAKFGKLNKPHFAGRRWPWVDPMKDAKAQQVALDAKLTTRTAILAEQGKDFEEVIEQLAIEEEFMRSHGIDPATDAAALVAQPAADADAAKKEIETLRGVQRGMSGQLAIMEGRLTEFLRPS